MEIIPSDKIRNIALISHNGAGKTILSEAMLFTSEAVTRMGKIEDGNTISDWEPEEIKRTGSIQTSLVPCIWNNHKINLLDTPGYADFRGEVTSALRVADSALLVISATDGIEVGTREMWNLAQQNNLPTIIFVSKVDKDNSEFESTTAEIIEAFGNKCVPIQIPVGSQSNLTDVISLLKDKSASTDSNPTWERLIEAIAETNDDLATKYLEGDKLTTEEIMTGLKNGVKTGEICPIVLGASPNSIGVKELMDTIIELMPSPLDIGSIEIKMTDSEDSSTIEPKKDSPLSVLVFKTTADPYVGKLTYLRVYSGTIKSDSQIWNSSKSQQEKISQLFMVRGKSQDNLAELVTGDIGAVAKLNVTGTGDTLCNKEKSLTLDGIIFQDPVLSMALYPKTKADTEKMTSSLSRLLEEDLSLQMYRDSDTAEVVLSGLGDTHIEIAVEKMKRKFGVEMITQIPKVPYRETIGGSAKVEYKHKKQSGGHGQYGHVWLELEPLPRGSGFEFSNKIVGGAVPKEYIPAVEKGINKALDGGVLAGFPIVDLRAVLFDGSYHPVDSSGVCFEIAGSHALSKGMKEANPVLLEPIMFVTVIVPDTYSGDVIGDLNSKRGRIHGMTPQGDGSTHIESDVPQAEILRYATELRSMTQGRGSFTMKFTRYEEVPQHISQPIVEAIQKEESKV